MRSPHQKGRVENGVAYVKGNFLNGLELTSFDPINPAAWQWLDTVANLRLHSETRQKPIDLLAEEKPHLRPLNPQPYEAAVIHSVRANRRFRVNFDANRYSVPARYARAALTLKAFPDRLCFCHQDQQIAQHVRSYDRHRDFEHPDHPAPLLAHAHNARYQHLLQRFLALGPRAAEYHRRLEQRRSAPRQHVRRIVALSDIYGPDQVARALEDGFVFEAFSAEYIANLLEQRHRQLPEPGALHLTRQTDILDLELPAPDLSIYNAKGGTP